MKLPLPPIAALLLFALPAVHAGPSKIRPLDDTHIKHRELPDEGASTPEVLLRIEVKAEYKDLTGEADFVTMNMTQCNHVVGGDRGFKIRTQNGEGLEFKRWGFIVNALPVVNPNDTTKVDTQFQIELSGPLKGDDAVEIETWQLQNETYSTMGKWKTISRKPALVKIRISVDKD